MRQPALLTLSMTALVLGCFAPDERAAGELVLSLIDAETGSETVARVELIDSDGEPVVPVGAMPIRRGECFDNAIPDWLQGARDVDGIFNPYTGTRNFYVDRHLETKLAAGNYQIRVFKGVEFEVTQAEVVIHPGVQAKVNLELRRWIDLPSDGWFGGDDHLHISRSGPDESPALARWMAAEGLHVANLLQGGSGTDFSVTPQFAFGREGAYRGAETLLLSGQEHPRTHILGHTIILGGTSPIDLRDEYLNYQLFWTEAERQGALSGYAHWGLGAGGFGLAIDAPTEMLSFVEVLDFDYAHYATWYDLLNMGFRITPTGGTDYPCNPYTIPGRDRFYTRVDGAPNIHSWLKGVRRGRTFVTNGPAIELDVAGAGIGDEKSMAKPGLLEVTGRVRFDTSRDDVQVLELVQAGEVVASVPRAGPIGKIELRETVEVEESTWFALRARGVKLGETVPPQASTSTRLVAKLLPKVQGGAPFADRFARDEPHWPSAAHTAAVFVEVEGTRLIAEQPTAARTAKRWGARLVDLRDRLESNRLEDLPIWSVPTGDGVPLKVIERDRSALLRAIERSAKVYERMQE